MPISRYRDWQSFVFPDRRARGDGGPGEGSGQDAPVAFGADLSPASVLGACRRGIVPLPASDDYLITLNEVRYEDEVAAGAIAIVGDGDGDPYEVAWWSPDPRPAIGVDGVHLGRNVRKRLRRDGLATSADTAFAAVAEACRANREPRWLTDPLLAALVELHRQGWAHSIEVWRGDDLVGGAIGIGIGGILSGDTLFGRQPGAAAIAVGDMAARLKAAGGTLIDAQWDGALLRSLGAVPLPRERYLALLDPAAGPLALPADREQADRLLPELTELTDRGR